ncbi:hypothetical protein H0H87_007326 [Tephrocybe sp. NHM501043]|nr:hypothetical protein H0H87_007326 [Tephrocybe sp. NHM501043]
MKRLRNLGYNEEVEYMTSFDYSDPMNELFDQDLVPFERQPAVRVARPLTDQVWSNIETKMLEHMGQVNERMLRQRRLRLEESRKGRALEVWRTFRKTLAPTLFTPTLVDILSLPDIQSLVDCPSDQEVSLEMFGRIFDYEMKNHLIEKFRVRHILELASKARATVYDSTGAAAQRKLEPSLLMHRFDIAAEEDDDDAPLFYPEFLYHACNSICRRKGFHKKDEYALWVLDHNKKLGVGREYRCCRRDMWSSEHLILHHKAQGVVRSILEACSLSSKTTVAKLDELEPRLICLKCTHGGKADGERICSVWSWRNAVSLDLNLSSNVLANL